MGPRGYVTGLFLAFLGLLLCAAVYAEPTQEQMVAALTREACLRGHPAVLPAMNEEEVRWLYERRWKCTEKGGCVTEVKLGKQETEEKAAEWLTAVFTAVFTGNAYVPQVIGGKVTTEECAKRTKGKISFWQCVVRISPMAFQYPKGELCGQENVIVKVSSGAYALYLGRQRVDPTPWLVTSRYGSVMHPIMPVDPPKSTPSALIQLHKLAAVFGGDRVVPKKGGPLLVIPAHTADTFYKYVAHKDGVEFGGFMSLKRGKEENEVVLKSSFHTRGDASSMSFHGVDTDWKGLKKHVVLDWHTHPCHNDAASRPPSEFDMPTALADEENGVGRGHLVFAAEGVYYHRPSTSIVKQGGIIMSSAVRDMRRLLGRLFNDHNGDGWSEAQVTRADYVQAFMQNGWEMHFFPRGTEARIPLARELYVHDDEENPFEGALAKSQHYQMTGGVRGDNGGKKTGMPDGDGAKDQATVAQTISADPTDDSSTPLPEPERSGAWPTGLWLCEVNRAKAEALLFAAHKKAVADSVAGLVTLVRRGRPGGNFPNWTATLSHFQGDPNTENPTEDDFIHFQVDTKLGMGVKYSTEDGWVNVSVKEFFEQETKLRKYVWLVPDCPGPNAWANTVVGGANADAESGSSDTL